jgi:hypothetical protein
MHLRVTAFKSNQEKLSLSSDSMRSSSEKITQIRSVIL